MEFRVQVQVDVGGIMKRWSLGLGWTMEVGKSGGVQVENGGY